MCLRPALRRSAAEHRHGWRQSHRGCQQGGLGCQAERLEEQREAGEALCGKRWASNLGLDSLADALRVPAQIVVDFSATWCGPCRVIGPYFEELSTAYPGLVFLKVDVDAVEVRALLRAARRVPRQTAGACAGAAAAASANKPADTWSGNQPVHLGGSVAGCVCRSWHQRDAHVPGAHPALPCAASAKLAPRWEASAWSVVAGRSVLDASLTSRSGRTERRWTSWWARPRTG